MDDYIKREDVIELFEKYISNDDELFRLLVHILINKVSTADVAEVKHGKWEVRTVRGETELYCSVCGNSPGILYEYRFCPNCGAKMDLK